jgi:hypothetical protein
MTSSAMGDNFFEGISCLSSTYCWAVGGKFTDEAYDGANNGYVYRWDGTSWTPAEVPATASVFSVSGIACPTMATCLATGYYANGAAVIDYGVSNGGTATAGVDQVSLTASGGTDNVDSVSEAQYGPDPVGALTDGTSFFDMALSSGNTFNNVVLEDCNDVTSSSTLDWWNPSANSGGGGWVEIVGDPGPTYIAGSPSCIMLTLDNSTTPSISQLNGSVVGVVGGGTPPPHKDAITSANTKMASAGRFFSFPVTTSGTPSPKLRERGKLPRGVKFHKGTGSAELSGTPQSTKHRSADGTYRLTFTATFGKGKTKVVVTQSFTLTVS